MSPDALEELELVASNFEASTATLLASDEEPKAAPPSRPLLWLSREDSSGILPDRAPVDEATKLKVNLRNARGQARR